MHKIKTISTYLLWILNILLFAIPLFIVITWYFIDVFSIDEFSSGLLQNSFQIYDDSGINWTLSSKLVGATGHIINLMPLFLSVFILKLIFKSYKAGHVFTTQNAIYYKHLGYLALIDALFANPIGNAIMIFSTSISELPESKHLAISYGYPSIEGLFCGLIFIIISLVMIEASKLQEESNLII